MENTDAKDENSIDVQTETSPKNAPVITSTRYRINLLLFLMLTIATMFWFYKHLYLYVTQSLLVGVSLTVWGIAKFGQSVLKWGAKEPETKQLAPRILGSVGSTEYLTLGLVLIGILFLATSSVYLIYEGAASGEAELDVEILHKENPYLQKVKLRSYDRVFGRPFFFRLNFITLRLKISDPRGYKEIERRFRPWTGLHVRIPADFERKNFHIVRLIPTARLYQRLPKATNETPGQTYTLRIITPQKTYSLSDLRRQSIYVGADEKDIEWLLGKETAETRNTILNQYFDKFENFPLNRRQNFINNWESNKRRVSTSEFQVGEQIQIEVRGDGDNQPLSLIKYRITSSEGIQTVFLEVNR